MASKDCDSCNSSGKAPASVHYVAFESYMYRAERIIKRLVIALIVTIDLNFASNIGWLIYVNNNGNTNSSYTVTQQGNPTSIIGDGNDSVMPQATPAE